MELTSLTLGDLQTNCYLVWDEDTREALIIDPADSGDFITDQVLQLQLEPVGIILTHGHFDHVLGLLEVSLNFQVPIMMHEADLFLIKQAQSSAFHWLNRRVDPVPLPDGLLKAGDVIRFGQEQLTVMETPGHTPGSIALHNDQAVFTGDTLFANGVGRTDFSYSDGKELRKSLDTIMALSPDLMAFAGHEEAFRLEDVVNTLVALEDISG